MPRNVAALHLLLRSSCDSIFETFTSVRLQNCIDLREISQHGFVPILISLVQKNPGSPHPEALTRCQMFIKSSSVTLFLSRTTELFARPLWGFSSHHAPVLHESISQSLILKREIRAALRIPPDNTASAIWHIIS